jgi:hypothetical protein
MQVMHCLVIASYSRLFAQKADLSKGIYGYGSVCLLINGAMKRAVVSLTLVVKRANDLAIELKNK